MKCDYCGKELQPVNINFNGREMKVGYFQCDCNESAEAKAEAAKKKLETETKIKQDKRTERIRRSGIPERYWKAICNSEMYRKAFQNGLYLYGEVGTGKTYTACGIGIQALDNNMSVKFIKAYELSHKFIDKYEMDIVTRPSLLIIDDLGSDNVSEWANTRMRAVIDDRYGAMKPTIVTSNYSLSELATKLQSDNDYTALAIVSRLKEMTEQIKVNGKRRR